MDKYPEIRKGITKVLVRIWGEWVPGVIVDESDKEYRIMTFANPHPDNDITVRKDENEYRLV